MKNEKIINDIDEFISLNNQYLSMLYESITLNNKLQKRLQKILPPEDVTDFDEIKQFNNYQGYVIISLLDLAVVFKNLYQAQSDWEKVFFIKHGYLTIHETIDKLKPYNGNSFVQQTINKKYPELRIGFNEVLNMIVEFKLKESYKKIRTTRNYIAGHIEKTKKYYETAYKLDGEEAGIIISEFIAILDKLIKIMSIYNEASNTKLIEIKEKTRKFAEKK